MKDSEVKDDKKAQEYSEKLKLKLRKKIVSLMHHRAASEEVKDVLSKAVKVLIK